MKKYTVLLFGAGSYLMFLGVFLYAVGFVGNFLVPTRLDGIPTLPMGKAILIDLGLLALFAVQHSVMARPFFKTALTRFVPEAAERSVYVLASNIAMCVMFWQWQPIGGVIWNIENPIGYAAMYSLFAFGWLTVLVTTCLINHFDLFGLRQVYLYFRGTEYTHVPFSAPGPYRLVRHPMYIGWLAAFWGTPTMTSAHFLFALGTTAYILIAIVLEEQDLVTILGRDYVEYRERVPKMIPRLFSRSASRSAMVSPTSTQGACEEMDNASRIVRTAKTHSVS